MSDSTNTTSISTTGVKCPVQHDSKTAELIDRVGRPQPGSRIIRGFEAARDMLFSPGVIQAGRGADLVPKDNPEHLPVAFLDGEIHRKRRGQIARFFTPKAMKERYSGVMERSTDKLIAQLLRDGRARLDQLSFDLACDVASVIVGLTNSDPHKLARRVRRAFFSKGFKQKVAMAMFYWLDVKPAIRARRKHKQDDVISLILEEGYSNQSILMEAITYGSAGMVTTREFIVVAAWHLFERDDLRTMFLNDGEEAQFAILDEILRIDPVVTFLQRRAVADGTGPDGEEIKAGELCALDLRSGNLDERVTGPCPYALDPARGRNQRMTSSWLSFGAGPHRCPGAQVAMHETRLFLDALLRVPGIRLANPPTPRWTGTTYELHGAYVECDRA